MITRRPFVAGNWKMNATRSSAIRLTSEIAKDLSREPAPVDVALCPPFPYLDAVGAALSENPTSAVSLGAQNAYHKPDGAFTGEVSLSMLRDLGVRFVLIGHSERRHILGESTALIAAKTAAVLASGLTCILCVGETIEQRERGETDRINEHQLLTALDGADPSQIASLILAYEPVWAIGTGRTATPQDAQAAHAHLRSVLADRFGQGRAEAVRILYGGSMKPENARELLLQPDIDGGLIGGASLQATSFTQIVRAAAPGV